MKSKWKPMFRKRNLEEHKLKQDGKTKNKKYYRVSMLEA